MNLQHLNDRDRDFLSFINGRNYVEVLLDWSSFASPKRSSPMHHALSIYEKLNGKACPTCTKYHRAVFEKLKNININLNEMSKSEPKFKLKKGVIISIFGTSNSYSEHNLTDTVAAKWLKENPNRRTLFTKIPDGFFEAKKPAKKPAKKT